MHKQGRTSVRCQPCFHGFGVHQRGRSEVYSALRREIGPSSPVFARLSILNPCWQGGSTSAGRDGIAPAFRRGLLSGSSRRLCGNAAALLSLAPCGRSGGGDMKSLRRRRFSAWHATAIHRISARSKRGEHRAPPRNWAKTAPTIPRLAIRNPRW